MPEFWLTAAEEVIRKSDRQNPADRMLRELLKDTRDTSAEERTLATQAVFAFYRWKGWLGEGKLSLLIEEALDFDASFQNDQTKIPEEELCRKAVPGWILPLVPPEQGWLRALQRQPALWLRAQKAKMDLILETMPGCTRPFRETFPEAILYRGTENLYRTSEFQSGTFEIQDISSQAVGRICDPKPKQTWWDACAGEGGKTLHLGDLMENKGMIWVSDTAKWRLDILKKRAGRAKMFNYRTAQWVDTNHLPTKTKFDGILVDAPCTGVGTWGRNPHARWTTTEQDVMELSSIQEKILIKVADLLKPGGKLVYSVCTLTMPETQAVCDKLEQAVPFLQPTSFANPFDSAVMAPRHYLWPQKTKGGGMFVATWVRK